jgi:hypothetical protein
MMIDVHLSDGRTVMRFASRGTVVTLIKRDPDQLDAHQSERCWIDRGQGEGFKPARLQYLRKHQIGWVEQLDHADADAFLAEQGEGFKRALELQRRKPRDPGVTEPSSA